MRILVIYATAGAGHRKAAEAVYNRLKEQGRHETVLVDALDHTSAFYKSLYSGSYTFMVAHMPWLWAFCFYLMDLPAMAPLVRLGRWFNNLVNGRSLAAYLRREQFDWIISTHFFPNEVAADLHEKGLIAAKIISVVTDFDVHRIWIAEGIDHYTAATEWTRKKLVQLGLKPEQTSATGIPTDRKFSQPRDIPVLKQKLGLQEGVFTVLMATGSFGIGPIAKILDALPDFQVVVVCGHNKVLYQELLPRQKALVKICGLVNNMDELMAAADVMITKPGGLSISEALVTGLPMIFINPIPGQETRNVSVLAQHGVGVPGDSIPGIVQALQRFRTSNTEWQAARGKAKALARPSAADDIIALIR